MSTTTLSVDPKDAATVGAALLASHRTGVLEELGTGVDSVEDLAARCGTDIRATAAVVGALSAVGVVEVDGSRFRLVSGAPPLAQMLEPLDHLADQLWTGQVPLQLDGAEGASAFYPTLTPWLADTTSTAAEHVAGLLARPGIRVLDLGAGAAGWSRAIAARHEDISVTAIELPAVAKVTREALAPLGTRAEVVEGEILDVEPGGEFDVVLAANLLHLFDASTARAVVEWAVARTVPDGVMAVVGFFPEVDGPAAALHHLSLVVRTVGGGVRSAAEHREWFAAVGLGRIDLEPLPGSPRQGLLTAAATRPTIDRAALLPLAEDEGAVDDV